MLYANYVRNKMRHLYKPIIAEAEGVPCVLEYSKGKYMKNYGIYGNSIQDGTPTPDNPVEIQSVGDFTKNLLPYPYISTTKTINGVTFTDNGDGSITVNGTATANAVFYLVDGESNYTLDKCGLKIGDSYTISKILVSGDSIANIYFTANYYDKNGKMQEGAVISNSNTATKTIKSDFKSWGIYLLVLKDKTVNNTTIKLQLEKGSSATEYEPYNKYDIPITVAGKNLIPYPYIYTTTTINGVTFTDNGDGSITVNGTATANAVFFLANNSNLTIKPNTTYTLSGFDELNVSQADLRVSDSLTTAYMVHRDNTSAVFQYSNTDKVYIQILIRNGTVCDNLKFKPQLELGSTATEYEPYHEANTTHIYLDEPLRKIGDYSDYIDFKNQKVVRNIKEVTFDGTENWDYRDTDNIIYLSINNVASSVYCYSTHFLSEALKDTVSPYFRPVTGILRLYQQSNNIFYSSADEFKAFLENQNTAGTPLIVDYILSTPVEENVSLPTLQTFKGTTIMSVDTTVLPSNIKATYIRT